MWPEVFLEFVGLGAELHAPFLVLSLHVVDVSGLLGGGDLLRRRPPEGPVFSQHFVEPFAGFVLRNEGSRGVEALFIVAQQGSVADHSSRRQNQLIFIAVEHLRRNLRIDIHSILLKSIKFRKSAKQMWFSLTLSG